ncbi:acyltransferase family protein [Acinetobacter guerrae]|uniref:acyltransferase family protein n=1 Tax=Acinetobacter guerrae TaxID=1843371 RepID=UPI00128DF48E|nr:acyltransferase [Acinetobacter guerrae]MPW44016.1 acyltransferase [Acinetobacter guerrae]
MDKFTKLNAVESIRGLACLAVVFSHLSLSFYPYLHHFDEHDVARNAWVHFIHHSPFAFWYSGTAAVYVFFVLSGFILSYVVCNSRNMQMKLQSMMVKRYPRLAIPALGSCILLWAALQFSDIDSSQVQYWLKVLATQDIGFAQAVYEGTIGSFLFAESSLNWVLWTMQVELLGSFLLFGLLYIYSLDKRLFLPLVLLFPTTSIFFQSQELYLGLLCFLIGSLIYFYGQVIRSSIFAIFLLALGLYLAGVHNNSSAYYWIYSLVGERTYEYCNFVAGILIVYSILMNPMLSKKLDNRVCVYLGKLSFSIYLLHLLLMYCVCLPVFNYFMALGWGYDSAAICSILIFFIALIICADLYSRYVDTLAINLSNRLSDWVLK